MARDTKESKAKKSNKFIGRWAFFSGMILAIIVGLLFEYMSKVDDIWLVTLVVIGCIIGLLNATEEETVPFLMSGAVIIIAGALGAGVMNRVPVVRGILPAMMMVFVPATIIVAIKNVFALEED